VKVLRSARRSTVSKAAAARYVAAALLSACAPAASSSDLRRCAPWTAPSAAPSAAPPTFRLSLRAPSRVTYDPQALGASGAFVTVVLQNVGACTANVPRLHASFAASRDGVAFRCNAHVGAPVGAMEPSWLGPGQSFSFERLLDCSMPLTGRYEVTVAVHPVEDEAGAQGAPQPAGTFAGSFAVDVVAHDGEAPHPLPACPGLYALMTGASTAPPYSAGVSTAGRYSLVLARVNAANREAVVGPARLSLAVSRDGTPISCPAGQSVPVPPATLEAGAINVDRVPLPCEPLPEGRYGIVGTLALGGGDAIEIGHVEVVVTTELPFPAPVDWP
jgi:hypothetical protein